MSCYSGVMYLQPEEVSQRWHAAVTAVCSLGIQRTLLKYQLFQFSPN